MLEIDIDAILALQDEGESVEGFTTKEWKEKLGLSLPKTQDLIKRGLELGVFKHRAVARKTFNGQNRSFDVYKYCG